MEEDAEDEDMEAGPELPPEDDVPDDEDGRFFGGGITSDTADAMNFIEENEGKELQVQYHEGAP